MSGIPPAALDLFKEKSWREVFLVSWKYVGNKQDNRIVLAFLALTLIFSWVLLYLYPRNFSAVAAVELLREWAVTGLSFSSQMLGFLVTGFAIFVTFLAPGMLLRLAEKKKEGTELSYAKFILYNFLMSFISFGLYMLISIFLVFLFRDGTPVWRLGLEVWALSRGAVKFALISICGCYFAFSLYVVLSLKSFVWSLYQTYLAAVVSSSLPDTRVDGS